MMIFAFSPPPSLTSFSLLFPFFAYWKTMQIDKRNADYQVSASNRLVCVCVCVWPKWPLNLEKKASRSIELALFWGSVFRSAMAPLFSVVMLPYTLAPFFLFFVTTNKANSAWTKAERKRKKLSI